MPFDSSIIVAIITSLVALIGGGGGILAFITARQKNEQDERSSSVMEWKQLYDEMKSRLDCQEEENQKLRQEISELKLHMTDLQRELDKYKRYDNYVYELESYIDVLLQAVSTLISEDAYKTLCKKKPSRPAKLKIPKEGV